MIGFQKQLGIILFWTTLITLDISSYLFSTISTAIINAKIKVYCKNVDIFSFYWQISLEHYIFCSANS